MNRNPKIIICDCDHKDVEMERAVFEAAGFGDFKWLNCKTEQDVIEQCQGAVALLNQYTPMNEKVFRGVPSLKMVVRYGVGVDNVNLEDATRYGVQICNVPDYGTNEVADQALALMLSITRKIHHVGNLTKSGVWNYQETIPVHRHSCRTVGIVGVGRIGTAFAHRVQALGCRVIACEPRFGKPPYQPPDFIEFQSSLEEVLQQSDVVSLHCSLTEETRNIMDATAFSQMKDGACFINVSRGGLVDEQALEAALASGKLSGAGLDVVCSEPLTKESPLFRHDNVVITPHMGWYSEESAMELKEKCAREAVRFVTGQRVHYPVNQV